jgi:hypothetical protein
MIQHSDKYEPSDRTILIRYEQQRDENHIPRAYWCHPSDGDVHGSSTNKYVEFDTVAEAERVAVNLGYDVILDIKY